jgi:hypothetical protein
VIVFKQIVEISVTGRLSLGPDMARYSKIYLTISGETPSAKESTQQMIIIIHNKNLNFNLLRKKSVQDTMTV